MAITKFLSRDLLIAIQVGGSGGPSYVPIKGLNTLTHSPSSSDAETTDFDSGGHSEHMKAERGDSWTIAGFTLEDVLNGDRDPGQAAVEALALTMGLGSLGVFRITSPGGNRLDFSGTAEVTRASGGNNDTASWQAVLRVSGAITFA